MTNPISRRLDRLESEIERQTNPGYPPVFNLTDNPRDPENAKRLEEAEKFRRDNPNGLIIQHTIVSPPNREPTRPRFERTDVLPAFRRRCLFVKAANPDRID